MQSRETSKFFALKDIDLQETRADLVREEFYNSVIVQCTNIVPCYALYRYNGTLAILQELMWGTLSNFMNLESGLNEAVIAYAMRESLKGLEFLHRNHTIHRDIKCENIFISLEGLVKVGDFGLSAQLTQERSDRETFAGSPLWMAPEILGKLNYGIASDIWSLGVSCYEMATGKNPYIMCKNLAQLEQVVIKGPEPRLNEEWSAEFREFMEFCLQKQPDQRKTCTELLNCKFLSNFDESSARRFILYVIQRAAN